MDKELIERLAYDAGLGDLSLAPKHGLDLYAAGITRFAALIAEECAKVCDARAEMQAPEKIDGIELMKWLDRRASDAACAARIRETFKAA